MKALLSFVAIAFIFMILLAACKKNRTTYVGPYSKMMGIGGRRYWTGSDQGAGVGVDSTTTPPFYHLISKSFTIQANEGDSTISVQDTTLVFTFFNLNGTYTFGSMDTVSKLMVFYNLALANPNPTNYVIYYYEADSLTFFATYNEANGYEFVNMTSN